MRKLTSNPWLRLLAIVLFLLTSLLACCCGLGLLLEDDGGYASDTMSFYETDKCYELANHAAYEVAVAFANGYYDDDWLSGYYDDENFRFASLVHKTADGERLIWLNGRPVDLLLPEGSAAAPIIGDEAEILELSAAADGQEDSPQTNPEAGQELEQQDNSIYVEEVESEIPVISPSEEQFSVDVGEGFHGAELISAQILENIKQPGVGASYFFEYTNCAMVFQVLDPITDPDSYQWNFYNSYHNFQLFYPLRKLLLPGALGGGFLSLLLFCFLLAGAGYRPGREEVSPSPQDKIPFDLYLFVAGIAVFWLGCLLDDLRYQGFSYELLVLSFIALLSGIILILLRTAMTFAVRVKLGQWWRNTIIFRLLHVLWRLLILAGRYFRSFCDTLPMSWRLLLSFIALLFLELFLFLLSIEGLPFFLLLLVALNIGLLFWLGFWGSGLQRLKKAAQRLAAGDFDYQTDTQKMPRVLAQHGAALNDIGQGMSIAVEQRMKSEHLKTELITNVSHDIKTPLTSIVNYVDLLQKPHSPEEEEQYLAVLSRQANRLKKLTEDLVEASKASTGNVQVELIPTNVNEILNQAVAEYTERLEAGRLQALVSLPEQPVEIMADGRLLWRVVDNLLNNVVKYALAGTRVYLAAFAQGQQAVITIKNVSRDALNLSVEELMERFVRGDRSRATEGSGLGLNIAKSLTELQGGTLSLFIDGDLFKAELRFPLLAAAERADYD